MFKDLFLGQAAALEKDKGLCRGAFQRELWVGYALIGCPSEFDCLRQQRVVFLEGERLLRR